MLQTQNTTVKPATSMTWMLDLSGELVNEKRTGERSSDGKWLKKNVKLNAKRRSSDFNIEKDNKQMTTKITQAEFDAAYDEFENAWNKNQASLDSISDEMDNFSGDKNSNEWKGILYRFDLLAKEEAELKTVKLPEASSVKQ